MGDPVADRARLSGGASDDAIYHAVVRGLAGRHPGGGTLVDVGCGTGRLWGHLGDRFAEYVGVDAVQYPDFPPDAAFHPADLDARPLPLPNGFADVVAAVEVIEHLENPRALMRELARVCRPGGWIVVTTPNQASLHAKLSFVLFDRFPAFRDAPGLYPAHRTALLPLDLSRLAAEAELSDIAVSFTDAGRVPGTARRWPVALGGKWFSDNAVLTARKPG